MVNSQYVTKSYKYAISFLMGLVAFGGIFFPIQIDFNGFSINFVFSLILPITVLLAWGGRYGFVASLFGVVFIYPFILGIFNGWASLVPTLSLFIWILIQGYGWRKRQSGEKWQYNIYFLQFLYIIVKVFMYLLLFPMLVLINPPVWNPDAYRIIGMQIVLIFALKGVILDLIILGVSDALLLMPFVKKIFKLKTSQKSKYNTLAIFGVTGVGMLFTFFILWLQHYIIDKEYGLGWVLAPDDKTKLILLLSLIFFIIMGGIVARFLEKNIEAKELLIKKNLEYEKAIIWIARLNDIFEKRVLERTKELNTTVKELEEFAYCIAHDLKSPIRSISQESIEIQKDVLKESSVLENAGKIEKNSREILLLIDKMLEYSVQSKKELETNYVSSRKMIEDIFLELREAIPERTIILNLKGEFPQIMVDEILFKEVIRNILSNGLKFTKKQEVALIDVEVRVKGPKYLFTFKDNGIGFNMKYQDKLFKMFQRLHHKEDFEGAGIGLSLAQKIVHSHGGEIWLKSIVNMGTEVFITVPKEKSDV